MMGDEFVSFSALSILSFHAQAITSGVLLKTTLMIVIEQFSAHLTSRSEPNLYYACCPNILCAAFCPAAFR
jgi:hypothetical protein